MMTAVLTALLAALLAAEPLVVRSIPLDSPNDEVFLAQTRPGNRPDVFILAGNQLRIVTIEHRPVERKILFPDGTTAFDSGDMDQDGRFEILAVCASGRAGHHASVLRFPLSGEESPARGEAAFQIATQLADPTGTPYPHVMLVDFNDGRFFASPTADMLELRDADGRLAHQFPIGADAPQRASFGSPFMASTVDPPQVAPWLAGASTPDTPGPFEAVVYQKVELLPALPAPLVTVDPAASSSPRAVLRESYPARNAEYSNWPWFPLSRDVNDRRKVLYAVSANTVVRIAGLETTTATRKDNLIDVGPERTYPGMLVPFENDIPDFNGDGFADLLLWTIADAATSIDSMARSLTSRDWPVRLTVHPFHAGKNRFDPRPWTHVTVSTPIRWFVDADDGFPLRHCLIQDFNGDGRSDLAFCDTESSYEVRLSTGDSLPQTPHARVHFDGPVRSIAFVADVMNNGAKCAGIRTDSTLYLILRPD